MFFLQIVILLQIEYTTTAEKLWFGIFYFNEFCGAQMENDQEIEFQEIKIDIFQEIKSF
jgi:hypothetical protein